MPAVDASSDDGFADDATFVADGIRYSKVGRDPTGAGTRLPWLGGLDSDPAGMACAARLELSAALSRQMDAEGADAGGEGTGEGAADDEEESGRHAPDTGRTDMSDPRARLRARIDDATGALALLARAGVRQADPASWAFAASARRLEEGNRDRRRSVGREGFDVTAARNAGLLRDRASAARNNPVPTPVAVPAAGSVTVPVSGVVAPAPAAGSAAPAPRPADRPPVVPLSPSAVDAIWRCPLCWSLDNRFSGPQPTDASRSLGTVIHEVARWATDNGLDRSLPDEGKMTNALAGEFRRLMASAPRFTDPDQTFRLASGTSDAGRMIGRMARYFVEGRDPDYGGRPARQKGKPGLDGAGTLGRTYAEVPFTAFFGLHDIGGFVRRTPGLEKVSDHELFVVLSWLAGGFPKGTREDLRLRLSARIDRLEQRGTAWDILDWKTGRSVDVRTFSDLQLVCYQLGLTFSGDLPADAGRRSSEITVRHPLPEAAGQKGDTQKGDAQKSAGRYPAIDRSLLFRLRLDEAPAASHGLPELGYQPPIFVNGHLNTSYPGRPWLTGVSRVFSDAVGRMDHTRIDDRSPVLLPRILDTLANGYHAAHPSSKEAGEAADHDLLPWTLAMISRVFYAGACLQTGVYPSRHGDDFTRYKEICPQWPLESQTVYGRLHADRLVLGADGRLTAVGAGTGGQEEQR